MIRRASGQFATAGLVNLPDLTIADYYAPLANNPANAAAWTTGSYITQQVDNVVSTGRPWTVLAYSVSAMLNIGKDVPNAVAFFGKLSPIVANVGTDVPSKPGIPGVTPWALGQLPYPVDSTKLATLFDPTSNPLPPAFNTAGGTAQIATTPTLPVTAGLTLPQPLQLQSGSALSVSLIMPPALLATSSETASAYRFMAVSMFVRAASYTVIYDDGAENKQSRLVPA